MRNLKLITLPKTGPTTPSWRAANFHLWDYFTAAMSCDDCWAGEPCGMCETGWVGSRRFVTQKGGH